MKYSDTYSGTVLINNNKYDYTIFEDKSVLVCRYGCEYCFSSSMIDANTKHIFAYKNEFGNFLEEYKKVLEIARKYIFLF